MNQVFRGFPNKISFYFGSLAQLVQSACLTSRGSIVRIYQFPQSNFMDQRVLRSEDSLRRLAISMQVGICAQVRIRCILGIVPITQEIRAHKAWGSGTEYTAGNPYGLCRELGHEVYLIWRYSSVWQSVCLPSRRSEVQIS